MRVAFLIERRNFYRLFGPIVERARVAELVGTALESHLGRLARDVALRAELGRRARSRIDGRGAVRVAQETERVVGSAR